MLTRRELLRGSAALLGGAAAGCFSAARKTGAPVAAYHDPTATTFPLLEVAGGPYDIGRAIGTRFAADIHQGFAQRAAWFHDLKAFADAQPPSLYDTFVAAARKHAPTVWEELRGWADGSGVPLRDLVVLNLKAEYEALRDQAKDSAKTLCERQPGCSTIVVHDGARLLVAHNEDGDMAYADHMFMLRVRPAGRPAFLCASYPGILPGNAPWINDRGIVMTTNFIYTKEVRIGVGRYFLDRLAMEARTVDEALAICRHPERAYAFHHVIASAAEQRAVSLEVTPSREELRKIDGLFIHTNHLIHGDLARAAQDPAYVGASSMTRWQVLSRWRASLANPRAVGPDDLVRALSTHEGRPYSPCRHPEGDIRGATLLTALFDVPRRRMRVYKHQPCGNHFHEWAAPPSPA